MKKIVQKLKNHKYRNLICVLGLVLVFIVLPHRAFAGALDVLGLTGLINWMFFRIGELFGILVTLLIGFLMRVAAYNDFTTSEAVRLGWGLMRDVCNMFFIVILMIIAVCTIIRVEAYNYKKMLPNLLVKAVLINFSLMFCGLLIDVSQVITLSFVSAFSVAGTGNFITGLGLDSVYKIATSKTPQDATTTLLYGMILLAIATVVIAALVFVFLGRIIAFWILIVLSPFTFLASASGGMGSKYADQWWSEFTKYLIVGPVLAFFLWLSLSVMKQSSLGVVSKTMSTGLPSVTFSDAGQPDNFVAFCISIAMLLGSLVAAQQIGTVGSGAAGKTLGGIKGFTSWAAKAAPGYANELFAVGSKKVTGVAMTLNPMDYYNSWKKARDYKSRQRLMEPQAHLDDIAHYGVGRFGVNLFRQGWSGVMGGDVKEQGKLRRAQKLDEYRMEFGSEKDAAGVRKLQEMKDEKNTLDVDLKSVISEKDDYIKEKEKKGEVLLTDSSGNVIDSTVMSFDSQIQERKTKIKELDEKIKGADTIQLTQEALEEEEKAEESIRQNIRNINGGLLSDQETHVRLQQISNALEKLAVVEKQTGLNEMQKTKKENLEGEQEDLKSYQEYIKTGAHENYDKIKNKGLVTKYDEKERNNKAIKESIKKEVEGLQQKADEHKDKAQIIRESQELKAPIDYHEITKRMANRKEKIEEKENKFLEISGPDKFYRESARRALVAEEQKKIADVKESSELVGYLRKAQKKKDFDKLSAVIKQMAQNGDDNEFLNEFGYKTGYGGFREFMQKEVIGKMGVDEQKALALSTDVGYINEGVNHWNTARMTKNENGKWRWNTQDEQTKAALGELLKKNDRQLMHSLNRFGYGEETQHADGSRTFSFTDIGKGLAMNLGPAFQRYFVNSKEGATNVIFKLAQDMPTINAMKNVWTKDVYKLFADSAGKTEKGIKDVSTLMEAIKKMMRESS
ncbi:MAG: hypothetical protein ABIC82_00050 [bacterium]